MQHPLQLGSRGLRGRRRPHVFMAALLVLWFGGTIAPTAQDTNTLVSTNELMQTEDPNGSDLSQGIDTTQDEETTGTNIVSQANGMSSPGPDGRTRRQRRRSQNRSRGTSNNREARPTIGDTNSNPSSLDYAAFRLVADRNIFDPNRAPRRGPVAQPKTVDAFTLVGTMSYEKGIFAFFDGATSDYKKALKPDETIAGFKVAAISADSVKLVQNTNVVELPVGTQMRRREDGTWEKNSSSESYAATAANTAAAESATTGADNDVLKRMMMRREKE